MAAHHNHSSASPGFEPDHPPTSGISTLVLVLLVSLAITIAGVIAVVKLQTQERRSGWSPDGIAARQEAHARASALTQEYVQIDAVKQVYRLPVSQAMKNVVQQPSLLGPLPKLLDEAPGGQ